MFRLFSIYFPMTKSEILIAVGNNIKRLRQRKGFSTLDLATQCGIEESKIQEIEKGSLEASTYQLYEISYALGVELRAIVER